MPIINATTADGQEVIVSCVQANVAKHVKIMQNKKLLNIKVLSDKPLPPKDIEVAPGIYQSIEDYEANMAYDAMRDNELTDIKI